MASRFKRLLLGHPLASTEERAHRLPKVLGLPVFGSDAISSTAYASEEILLILVPVMGMAALDQLLPLSFVVMGLLGAVVTSYRQTIYAYPGGGGAYVVARDNLPEAFSLVAGAALLVDYSLTVAVSISAGVAAVVSAFPSLLHLRVELALVVVGFMTLANLRGARESGRLFAIPTYAYIVSLGALLTVGLVRSYAGALRPVPVSEQALTELTGGQVEGLVGLTGALLLMRAFSSGAVALTGTEAITNGIPAFRPPEARNASRTLLMMAVTLGAFFFGISLLADRLRPLVSEEETLLSIMGGAVFGRDNLAYYVVQGTTMGILFLAANTAYADFPRVSSIIARDGYLPRQLATRGERLVFSNGILLLAAFAAMLLVAFGGLTTALIPLYAVGVFTGFTISQTGMVVHHLRTREPAWRRGAVINAVGATATGIVMLVIIVSKLTTGAWIPLVVIPAITLLFRFVHRHYQQVRDTLRVPDGYRAPQWEHTVIVLVSRVHRGAINAIEYARSLAPDHLFALSVVASDEEEHKVRDQWAAGHVPGVPLDVIQSPYRRLIGPVLDYVDGIDRRWDDDIVTVVIPEFVVGRWWEGLLHNQSALRLKARLRLRPNTIVTSVPLHLAPERHQRPTGPRPHGADDASQGP